MTNYFKKYNKYKNKYLNLKYQLGSGDRKRKYDESNPETHANTSDNTSHERKDQDQNQELKLTDLPLEIVSHVLSLFDKTTSDYQKVLENLMRISKDKEFNEIIDTLYVDSYLK